MSEPEGDGAAAFEQQCYVLRLFVTGNTTRSIRAIENLQRLCEAQLQGRYKLEVVDIYENPEAARDDQVIAAPTLVKQLPLPVRRIIGDLANEDRVLRGLDLTAFQEPHTGPTKSDK